MQNLFYGIIILCALVGVVLASYIWRKKTLHAKMICPLGSDCDAVIHSEYARFFGVPVEVLGILYYAFIAVAYSILVFVPHAANALLIASVLMVSMAAFLFSAYLTFIQAFALKQWCTWCLASAGLCAGIFGLAFLASPFGFIGLLSQHHIFILLLHAIGFAIGLGGATISDIFFFRFLKDLRISQRESDVLSILSQIIWFALALIVLSGMGLYLPDAHALNTSAKFLVKMIVVGVIIINGAFLNLLIAPKLVKISFGKAHEHETGELHRERKLAFALGAVSITSWYAAFILGALRDVSLSFGLLLFLYLSILFMAIIISQFIERSVSQRTF